MVVETSPLLEEGLHNAGNGNSGRRSLSSIGRTQRKVLISLIALSALVAVGMVFESHYSASAFDHQHRAASSPPRFSQLASSLSMGEESLAEREAFISWLPKTMQGLINNSVDPCNDFHAWACGTFEDDTPIPSDKSSFSYSWDGDAKTITFELQHMMESDKGKVGDYYAACMNSQLVEERGLVPAQPWLTMIDGISDLSSLSVVVAKLHQAEVGNLFDWFLSSDDQDPSRELLSIDSGGLDLPDSSYYTSKTPRNEKHREVYRSYLLGLYELYGVDAADAKEMVDDVVNIETLLASHENDDNALRHAPRHNLDSLEKEYPNFKWRLYFATLDHPDISSQFDQILTPSPQWLKAMDDMLGTLPLSKVKNYIRSHFMFNVSPLLGKAFFANNLQIDNDLYGVSAHPKRAEKCVGATKAALPFLVSKMFVDKYFSADDKAIATAMLENIRDAFHEDLLTIPWMSETSRTAALDKLSKIFFEVGYPSVWPEYHFPVSANTYFENSLQSSVWRTTRKYLRLRIPINRKRWTMSPATVNAYYDNGVNGVFVPAGLLQSPFFDNTMPLAHNYGSAGAIMAHELTHGFDNSGRKYDAESRKRQWWDDETVKEFKSRAECIAELYSDFHVDASHHVHGNSTLGENIADIGGLKTAHAAYLAQEAKKTKGGADLNHRKMFWTSFAQTWCGVNRKRVLLLNLLTDVHSPDKFRIIGPLSQNEDFARDFQCPAGSAMNPVKRCELW